MSKVHVLGRSNNGFQVVIHTPTPVGNNARGYAVKDILIAEGITGPNYNDGNGSVLPNKSQDPATVPGAISAAEVTDLNNGDILEIVGTIRAIDGATSNLNFEVEIDTLVSQTIAALQSQYNQYGRNHG